jgi:PAS domain S-box-containing protein
VNTLAQVPDSAVFLAAIVESFEDSIITMDREAHILSWNHGAEVLYGYSADEAVGRHISLLLERGDLGIVLDAMDRVAVGEHVPQFEMERIRKDGCRVNVSVKLSAVRDHEGKFIGVASLSRDISEQKHAREALHRSEAQFRMLTETIPQLVWTCSIDGYCDYISPQWGRYTGIPSEEQLGHKWVEAIHPDDRAHMRTCWESAIQYEIPIDLEYRLRDAAGNYRWFQVRGAPIRDDAGRILKWFGTCTDIESSKREQGKLEKLVAERTRRPAHHHQRTRNLLLFHGSRYACAPQGHEQFRPYPP